MKKGWVVLLSAMMVIQLVGCASFEKKFTRKSKKPEHIPAVVYFEEGAHKKQYTNVYYYKMHFTLWKNWQAELIEAVGGNSKQLERSAQETRNHLDEMMRYLTPEKQEELGRYRESLIQILDRLTDHALDTTYAEKSKSDLERIKRGISNNFYYDKVKEDVLVDKVDLGQ